MLKAGYIINTGQYMNYETFGNLQFKPLQKFFFHIIHIELRHTISEKVPVVSLGNTWLVLMLRKAFNIHF